MFLFSDEEVVEEYRRPPPKSRKSKSHDADAADDEEADQDEGHAKPSRSRKSTAASIAASSATTGTTRSRRGGKANEEADLATDQLELPSPIYQKLANSKAPPKLIAHELLKQYADADGRYDRIKLGLANALLSACGCTRILKKADLDMDPSEIVRESSDSSQQSTIEPPLTRVKNFVPRWIDFWQVSENALYPQQEG